MSEDKIAHYSIIQYCPDARKLEAVNVGVALYFPESGQLDSRVTTNILRVQKFFKNEIDFNFVKSNIGGMDYRIKHNLPLSNLADFQKFIDTRANEIRLSQPRAIVLVEPFQETLEMLYKEIVDSGKYEGEESLANTRILKKQFDQRINQPEIRGKITKNYKVELIEGEKPRPYPYAFKNGCLNLIKLVHMNQKSSRHFENSIFLCDGEGRSISKSPGEKKSLIVVNDLTDEGKIREAENILQEVGVRMFPSNKIENLIQEIQQTAHPIP